MKKLIPLLIWLITTILGKTWRVATVAPDGIDIFDSRSTPKIYCFWHETLLVVSYICRNTGKTAIVSQSRDGAMAAGVARRWGHGIIFGSSSRGGAAALRQSVRAIRDGRSLGITPDGPKGPRRVVKPGAAQIAIVCKTPVVAIKIDAKHAWRLKSWDRFMIPWPFAKITMTLSEPMEPVATAGDGNSINGNGLNGATGNNAVDSGRALEILVSKIQEKMA